MFFFHVCDGAGFCEDPEGRELPDLDAAKQEAIRGLRDIMAGEVQAGRLNLAAFIEIEDQDGRALATFSAREAVQVRTELGSSPRH